MPEPEKHEPRFEGDYARDTHRGGLGDDYAREGGWSGGGRADDVVREHDHSDEPIGKASE
ncbi:MAG TPA: hypothetical protein VF215_17405 [Thermoanaerobaculia bacterium]